MELKANKERMQQRIDRIASYTSEPGRITRLTFSDAWVQAVGYVRNEMESMGMTVRMDTFGNLIGNYNPGNSTEKPIGIGSHIDSVVNAGAYDGVAGICQKGYFGGRFMTGNLSAEECKKFRNINGKNIEDLQRECPLFDGVIFGTDDGWEKDYYQRLYEVHVEQGGVMEAAGKDIGIVKGVVGIGRLFIDFFGESDHAGPTVMSVRKDAMVAASDFILKAWEVGQAHNGKAVTTVARIQNSPNIHNVIAGKTSIVFDLSLKEKYGVGVEITQEIYTPRVLFAEELVHELRALQMPNSMELFSWAGHDAKAYSEIVDTCMVFMPSIGGKSHCPEEYTSMDSFALTCEQIINLFI